MMELLQELFRVKEKGSSLRTEMLASATSFFSIVYIVAVNALILSQAGMDYNSVVIATILTTAVSNILMGLYANSPLILAPGMSDNAFFTYILVDAFAFYLATKFIDYLYRRATLLSVDAFQRGRSTPSLHPGDFDQRDERGSRLLPDIPWFEERRHHRILRGYNRGTE